MATNANSFTSIIDALNLKELPEEAQEEILLDLNDLIYKGTMIRLVERMDEKTRIAFSKILDEHVSDEEVEAFIQKHVPNSAAAMQESIDELTSDILTVTK